MISDATHQKLIPALSKSIIMMASLLVKQIANALESGDVQEAHHLFNSKTYMDNSRVTQFLISTNRMDLLDLAIKAGVAWITERTCDIAAGVSLPMLKLCMKLGDCKVTADAACNAAKAGLINVLEYLKSINAEFNWGPSMNALKYDRLDVFQWVEENYPDRVYYSYNYRLQGSTFACQQYLYSLGHMPNYHHYKTAVEVGDDDYAEWLKEIKCPGTFEISKVPNDYKKRFKSNLNPGDFPWLLELARKKKFPSIKELYWTPPILEISKEFLEYANDRKVASYLLGYVTNEKYTLKYLYGSRLQELLLAIPQYAVEILAQLNLQPYLLADLYFKCKADSDNELNNNLANHLESSICWGTLFYVELNQWIEIEGSYQAVEFANVISDLWKKFESRIPQFADDNNKRKWAQITKEPWKDEMYEFLALLNL